MRGWLDGWRWGLWGLLPAWAQERVWRAIGRWSRTWHRGCRVTGPVTFGAARRGTREPPGGGRAREGDRLRVLLQVDDFTQGGLEQVVIDLGRYMQEQGHRVWLLVLGQAGLAAAPAQAAGLAVVRLPRRRREEHYGRWLREQQIDLVSAHASRFGAATATAAGVPFVATFHNCCVGFTPAERAAWQRNDAYTAAYVCVSATVARYTEERLGLPGEKLVVIGNGIDPSRLEACDPVRERARLREELHLGPDDFVFVNVASILPAKGQTLLVEAMAQVAAQCPRAKVVCVGRVMSEAYAAQVRRLIGAYGLGGRVILTGYRADVAGFYRLADAFVLPSHWEGWSLALDEAVYAGLPIVASDAGGAREQIPAGAGRVVTVPCGSITELDSANVHWYLASAHPRFVRELAEAMEAVYRDPVRPEATPAVRERLDWRRAYGRHEVLYRWLVGGGRPAEVRDLSAMPAQAGRLRRG